MRRALLLLPILALAFTTPASAATPDEAATEPLLSAIVTVRGPGVAEQAGLPGQPMISGAASADTWPPEDRSLARAQLLLQAEAVVARAQAPVLAAAARLGVPVVDRYSTALNGLLVHATASQLAALRRTPGVVAVESAPLVRPALARSVPYIGATRLAEEAGFKGDGVVVAVIDTGVDYTHADFGGPGTAEAYNAANLKPNDIQDQWEGQPLFPSPQVIGGWDFVGSRYTSPSFCSAGDEAAGRCRGTPAPDPDPLDERSGNWADGHGTHVAGIVAGLGTPATPPGVAPGAKLVVLKVFGLPAGNIQPDAPSDVLVSAFEWCVRVNLGLPVPGTAPERVDVINMSLGGWYDAGGLAYRQALAAARDAGIVIVAAVGNDGDVGFIANAPGTAPEALSVASANIGVPWTYSPDPALRRLGAISSFSGRGPGANGALKPDLTALGQGIVSAAMGRGTESRSSSGTSMATPLVSGAAALLVQRNRAEGLDLTARELSALLMNQAQFGVLGDDGQPAPVARQGAGMMDAYRAGRAAFVATAGDTASLNLGAVSVMGSMRLTQDITVRNLSDGPLAVTARWEPRTPWAEAAVGVSLPAGPVAIPARGSAVVPMSVHIDGVSVGNDLREWDELGRGGVIDEGYLAGAEVDGSIVLLAEGVPEPAIASAGLPLYLLPRGASAVHAVARGAGGIELANGEAAVDAEGIALLNIPAGAPDTDPDEPDVAGALDLRHAAGIFGPAERPEWLEIAVALAEPLSVPQLTSLELYLDTDEDGAMDYRVRTGPDSLFSFDGDAERMRLGVVAWDDAAGEPSGAEQLMKGGDIHIYSRVITVRVPTGDIGMAEGAADTPHPIQFYVIHRGLNERWRPGPEFDVAPDGAEEAGGPRFAVDLSLVDNGKHSVAAGAPARIPLPPAAHTVLAVYPTNRFEPDGAQFQLIPPGPIAPPSAVYLPMLMRR